MIGDVLFYSIIVPGCGCFKVSNLVDIYLWVWVRVMIFVGIRVTGWVNNVLGLG